MGHEIGIDVVDCDLHPTIVDEAASLAPYLTKGQLERLEWLGVGDPARSSRPAGRANRFNEPFHIDAAPPNGGPPASDIGHIVNHYLDPNGIAAALLTPMQPAAVDSWQFPEEAAWCVSAYNDLFCEEWLTADPRFNLAMIVSPLDIPLAVEEIKRVGERPGVAAIWLPALDRPYGERYFYPIYELAQDLDLAVMSHPSTGDDFLGTPSRSATGITSWAERYATLNTFAQVHLTSLIFEGVFERFPRLRFCFIEYAWTWLPGLLWRLDDTYRAARWNHPWMQRTPTEYVLEHVRFGTQPSLEIPKAQVATMLEQVHAETTLMFSSDYPHWDSEEPRLIFDKAPASVRQRIFSDTARETLGSRLRIAAPTV